MHLIHNKQKWIALVMFTLLQVYGIINLKSADFNYKVLMDTKETSPIVSGGKIYRSIRDTGDRKVIRIVDGPLPGDNRAMLKEALEGDRTIEDSLQTSRIVILKPGVYKVSDFLTIRGGTTLVGTTCTDALGTVVRTTIELDPGLSTHFVKNDPEGGLRIPNPHGLLEGVRPIIVVANSRNQYFQGHMETWNENEQLQVILSNGIVNPTAEPSDQRTFSEIYGFANDVFQVSLRNFDIVIPSSATGAIGVLWRAAQQSFIEDVNVISSYADAVNVGGFAGFVAQGTGGGGYWRNCRVTGTQFGVQGYLGQLTILDFIFNNISGVPLFWSYQKASLVLRRIQVSNCPHGLVFDGCAGISIIDSYLNVPNFGAPAFIPITLLNPDWQKNVYLQNVRTQANYLVRKRPWNVFPDDIVSLSNWEEYREDFWYHDTYHIPRIGTEAKAEHWVSGGAVMDQIRFEQEELPVSSKGFPELDNVPPPPVNERPVHWYNIPPDSTKNHSATIQCAIKIASDNNADLIIPPGKYPCKEAIHLENNSRIFGIQYPLIECQHKDNSWKNAESPKAFFSTLEGAGSVLVDGLCILNEADASHGDTSAAGMILLDWRCHARIINTQVFSARHIKANIHIGKHASGFLLNCFASSAPNGPSVSILGEDCTGPIDLVAVNPEHARHAGIQLNNCSNFNFLTLQFEQTGMLSSDVNEEPTWSGLPKSEQPRDIHLEGCKEIRFLAQREPLGGGKVEKLRLKSAA